MQTVNFRLIFLFASIAVSTCASLQALAELKIRLKDGRVVAVPVDQADVDSLDFVKTQNARSPLERAAKKIRDDAKQVRTAAQAARRAAAAAKAAVKAAEAAQEAAREAAKAADEARRLAHKPSDPADQPYLGSAPSEARPKAPPSGGQILSVGPGKAYSVPSRAAKAARDGDIIEIQAGTYRGDVAVWQADNLVIRGVGGRVVLDAAGESAGGKGIWIIRGRNTTVQNIAFTGARVRSRNGAGIRLEGTGLIVRDSEFYDNEMGILTGSNPESDILIERSRFYRNTVDYPRYRRLGHNIYIGRVRSFTLRFSYVSGAQYGHNVKSRAHTNRIAYNKIIDGPDGFSSYLLDLHGAGRSYIIGNIFHQSRRTENSALVSIGAENPNATDLFYFVNNTFVNDKGSGVFIRRKSTGETMAINNIFAGGGTVLTGSGKLMANLIVDDQKYRQMGSFFSDQPLIPGEDELKGNFVSQTAGFVDPERMDFRLRRGSPAIDKGLGPAEISGDNLAPSFQYRRHMKGVPRTVQGRVDIGAYEYSND